MKNNLFKNPLSVWNKDNFKMVLVGEKNKPLAYLKHFNRCCRRSYQRISKGYCETDAWSINYYLENLIPSLLSELKKNHHSSPVLSENKELMGDNQHTLNLKCNKAEIDEAWEDVLNQMILLWNESRDDICLQKNPYEAEYNRCLIEFEEKYGVFGERLKTAEEIRRERENNEHFVHFIDEAREYEEITKRWTEAEQALDKYKENCRNEAIDMLKKYWIALWD